MPHPNSPAGRSSPTSKFDLHDAFDGKVDFAGWASGVADTVRGILKQESILELFGDVKLLGGTSVVADAFHEYKTHLPDPNNLLSATASDIRGDTWAVEARIGLAAIAPWLAIAALVIDPIQHARHRKGIMDFAGEAGRTVVQEFVRQFPTDRDAIVWLLRFAFERTQAGGPASSSGRASQAVAHQRPPHHPGISGKAGQPGFHQRTDWSELDKAIAQDDKDLKQKGLDDFLREK
jgi:hypothetical protein